MNSLDKIKNNIRDFGKFGSFAVLTMLMPIVGSVVLLASAYQFAPWLQANREIGFVVFISLMTIVSGLALLAINVLGVLSGFAFDFELGLLAQIIGILGASTLMFFIAKRFASQDFLSTIGKKPKVKVIHNALTRDNFYKTLLIVTLLRLSPAMPFAATNFSIAAAGVSFKTFILGTAIGMTPRAVAVVFVGSSLSELDFTTPKDTGMLILGILSTVLAVVLIGYLSNKALQNLTVKESN
jgi:uncharacterized membrane protein YdjX (TVP38/TMEM64 family)